MIDTTRESWLRVTFSMRGTVVPHIAPRVLAVVGMAAAVALGAKIAGQPVKALSQAHALTGLAMSLLLVFKTNASYDRFWEARKLWGAIVNASRNLVRIAAAFGEAEDLARFASCYCLALKQHLRNHSQALDELAPFANAEQIRRWATHPNPPLAIAESMTIAVAQRVKEGALSDVTARSLETQIAVLIDAQGGCERIRRTPIPHSYVAAVRQILFVYLITLPFPLVADLGFWAVPAAGFVAFALLGIEEAGSEIEDPFGTDPNDLPLERICATISTDTFATARLSV